ncbi:MAG: tetratricopeptide repeat protein [Desulfovibrionaceae bacterium]|nr:tetratricopeptide repeat protein [Desulfovibrionaceae bacterium]
MSNKYLGVYSTVETSNTPGKRNSYNYGYKSSQTIRKRYWYAWEWDTGTVLVLNADENYKPVGQPRILVYAVFDSRFSLDENKTRILPEPEFPVVSQSKGETGDAAAPAQKAAEAGEKAAAPVVSAEKQKPQLPEELSPEGDQPSVKVRQSASGGGSRSARKARHVYSAEEIELAEQDAVASFEDGLKLFNIGNRSEALRDFEWPLHLNVLWQRKHKHLFSDFGITLRKIKEGELALKYHQKALSLSPDEPNIMFNLARTYLVLGNLPAAKSYIEFVLARNPDLKVGRLLKDYIDRNL